MAKPRPAEAPVRAKGRAIRRCARAEPASCSPIRRQRQQTLPEMLAELPTVCDRGTKCTAQGYKTSGNDYKLHIDTADCGVSVSAVLCSAWMHDSAAAVPLSRLTAARVTNLYDLMDAAYCSKELHADNRSLGHIPLIDHNPRSGEGELFAPPPRRLRYRERSVA